MAGRLHIDQFDPATLLPRLKGSETLITSPNMAPRRHLTAIRLEHGTLQAVPMFWGMTPGWLEVLDHAPHNARAESLDERRMFREAFAARRCLVPVSGVYVWKEQLRMKQPFLVTTASRAPFLLAAIWCRYFTDATTAFDSLALVTVEANAFLAPVTDRFPTLIAPDEAQAWLDPRTPLTQARSLLAPAPNEQLGLFPVSRRVNNPAHQGRECAWPTGPMHLVTDMP
ncbi:putative SOS response-associated peptidase YedK [Kushneria sinocarnis]|uniref:Abasic site processing protein n=1 Tax=Kushneria sinocarnis TaxID=595502 RepID=A0A420WXX6_9GAMM|nr:SOS response-associated peptidase [Kushneria sinocarnis]RKR04532.1 putative SOS response-associated peptidase YedK [Kushneria sinocarnis]